jgi:hypothetical protein
MRELRALLLEARADSTINNIKVAILIVFFIVSPCSVLLLLLGCCEVDRRPYFVGRRDGHPNLSRCDADRARHRNQQSITGGNAST